MKANRAEEQGLPQAALGSPGRRMGSALVCQPPQLRPRDKGKVLLVQETHQTDLWAGVVTSNKETGKGRRAAASNCPSLSHWRFKVKALGNMQ